MPTFYLMRHGQAEMHASTDAERQLTAYGRSYTQQIAEQLTHILSKYQKDIPILLHSPFRRATETAQIMQSAISEKFAKDEASNQAHSASSNSYEFLSATPDTKPQECFDALNDFADRSFLLVSHMPLIASLASLLEQGNVFQAHAFQTSEMRVYDADQWLAGSGSFKYRLL